MPKLIPRTFIRRCTCCGIAYDCRIVGGIVTIKITLPDVKSNFDTYHDLDFCTKCLQGFQETINEYECADLNAEHCPE